MLRRVRPRFPKERHVPEDPRHRMIRAHASKKPGEEQVYWVSTTSKEWRPHAAPVWGIASASATTDPGGLAAILGRSSA